jgi:formylmethanofuran dehydrogenase subunit D
MASDQIENKDTNEIRFSPDYLKVISSYGKVVRKWKGNKQILMFTSEKYPDRVFIPAVKTA